MIKFFKILILIFLSFAIKAEPKKIVLWSWERYDDLSYIDSSTTIVAPLIATFIINDDKKLVTKLRLNRYKVPPLTETIPVFRLEIKPNDLSLKTMQQIIKEIVFLSKEGQLIQLDFDAKLSQRDWYKEMIEELIDHDRQVSMTALASLCTFDPWLDSLPIEYAVPMLYSAKKFDKGLEVAKAIFNKLGYRLVKKCNRYTGVLADDIINIANNHTLFIFNNLAWTRDQYNKVKKYE